MLAIFRSSVCLALLQMTLVWTAAMAAEEQAETETVPVPAVPDDLGEAVPAVPSDADDELSAILQNWQRACAKITRLDARFERYEYDQVFAVESRGDGELAVDVQGRGAYRLAPARIEEGELSQRKDAEGKPYALKPADPDRWHWTGDSLIRVDVRERTYQSTPLPPTTLDPKSNSPQSPQGPQMDRNPPADAKRAERRADDLGEHETPAPQPAARPPGSWTELIACVVGTVVVSVALMVILSTADFGTGFPTLEEFPLAHPFLLATPIDELQQRFEIKLIRQTEADIWLEFTPLTARDRNRFTSADLLLNRANYKPQAIRTIDPSGNKTVVHVLTNVRVNATTNYYFFPVERLDAPNLERLRRLPDPVMQDSYR